MNELAQELITFIVREIIRQDVQITGDTRLVSSGLIDSLALIEILAKLEDVMRMRIPTGKVQAKDMDTVDLMIATAKRVGKPLIR